ncbi:TPA: hypothetical protein BOS_8614 [Bos taurus]|nr:TPA: hypothetical protein BOS_8614 [Bos taurus]
MHPRILHLPASYENDLLASRLKDTVSREILSIRQLLAGLAPPKAPADALASVSVHPAYVSVRRPLGGMEVLPLKERKLRRIKAPEDCFRGCCFPGEEPLQAVPGRPLKSNRGDGRVRTQAYRVAAVCDQQLLYPDGQGQCPLENEAWVESAVLGTGRGAVAQVAWAPLGALRWDCRNQNSPF